MASLSLTSPTAKDVVCVMAILKTHKPVHIKINELKKRQFISLSVSSELFHRTNCYQTVVQIADKEAVYLFEATGSRMFSKMLAFKRALTFIEDRLAEAIDRNVLQIIDSRVFLEELVDAFKRVDRPVFEPLEKLRQLELYGGIAVDIIQPRDLCDGHLHQHHQFAASVTIGKVVSFNGWHYTPDSCLHMAVDSALAYLRELVEVKETVEKFPAETNGQCRRQCAICRLVIFNEMHYLTHQMGHFEGRRNVQ